jgi:hypothetical protein
MRGIKQNKIDWEEPENKERIKKNSMKINNFTIHYT